MALYKSPKDMEEDHYIGLDDTLEDLGYHGGSLESPVPVELWVNSKHPDFARVYHTGLA